MKRVSKSDEFSALAKAATQGEWSAGFLDGVGEIIVQSPENDTSYIARDLMSDDANFIAFCGTERAWMESCARLKDAVEKSSDDLVQRIAKSVVEMRVAGVISGQNAVKVTPSKKTLDEVRFALTALADMVR